jgi:hypothetical protein
MRWFKYILCFGLIFLINETYAQVPKTTAQEFFVRIAANVVDVTNGKNLPFAYVTSLRTKRVTPTDSNGYFTAVISQKDTLRISSIGYQDVLYVKDNQKHGNYYTTIAMQPKSYELGAQKLRKRYKPLTVRQEYANEQEWRQYLIKRGDVSVKATFTSPISALYEMFGKRPRQQRKLQDLVMRRATEEAVATRYNRDVVANYTGLSGDDLTEFMRYCPVSDEFILTASDYELAARIYRCLEALKNGE